MKTVYKNMKRKRLVAIPLIILWIILMGLLLFYYGYSNLKSNSVYYAKYTPHKEGVEPELMMLVDNLYWIYRPDIKGIRYDFDGKPAILTFDDKGKQIGFLTTTTYTHNKGGYLLDDGNLMFDFDNKFRMVDACESDDVFKEVDIKTLNENDVKKEIYRFLKPVIDRQIKPTINLQWLFDMVYKDKFN